MRLNEVARAADAVHNFTCSRKPASDRALTFIRCLKRTSATRYCEAVGMTRLLLFWCEDSVIFRSRRGVSEFESAHPRFCVGHN